jgi:O-Antigen ligase
MGARAIRELPLAAALLLTAVALFHGGATTNGLLPWVGGGLLLVLTVLVATGGVPGGWLSLAPLAGLTTWLALSIGWSALPDRSWDYADRTFVYLLFAALGLWLADRRRALAVGLAGLLGAVVLWSLGGKVFPAGSPSVIGVQSRLQSPVGLWNQLALLGDFALPLALWLARSRRGLGTLLAFAWGVAIVLTLSRGGLAVAVVVVVLWLVFDDDRWGSALTVVAAGVPAAAVAGLAFALPGVTGSTQASSTRWRDGLIFGALLLVGAAASLALARLPKPEGSPALRRALFALAALALVAVLVVGALKAGSAWRQFTSSVEVGNQGPRASLSSNFRWIWWQQAWHGFTHAPLVGNGAGAFHVTNLRYRTSYLDVTSEPHDLPLQFLSEGGIVGLLLFLGAAGALLRGSLHRRGHELALGLMLPAFLLHSLVDIDWDFVAVAAPAFLAAGALAGRPAMRRVSAFTAATVAAAGALVFAVLLLPWLGQRWADQAFFSLDRTQATTLANRARSVDPLLVEPLWALADANSGNPPKALGYLTDATRRQPENAQTWLQKAQYELAFGCARAALKDFYRFNALDPYERPDNGPDQYRQALRQVNTGKPSC